MDKTETLKSPKEMIDALGILDKIIAGTFVRHAGLSEEEFLKEIGREGVSEEKAVLEGKFTLLTEITKEIFKAQETTKLINATLELLKEKEDGRTSG